ncbi:MAG TPA: hypothetical protein VFQ37_13640 [Mycobacterium sp.]|nr:hypothetical protein [Mycobacterium sp.]
MDRVRPALESRKADTRNNAENHRYALAPAATRRGDGKTLGIDAVFGGYPLNKITREYIQAWVNRLVEAGKKPSTVRHAFWTVRMVLEQAVVDGRLAKNPAEHVKLPKERGQRVRRWAWSTARSSSPQHRFLRSWKRRLGRTTS